MIAAERMYLTAGRDRIVPEGHPDAAFLYAAPGDEVPDSAAELIGGLADLADDLAAADAPAQAAAEAAAAEAAAKAAEEAAAAEAAKEAAAAADKEAKGGKATKAKG